MNAPSCYAVHCQFMLQQLLVQHRCHKDSDVLKSSWNQVRTEFSAGARVRMYGILSTVTRHRLAQMAVALTRSNESSKRKELQIAKRRSRSRSYRGVDRTGASMK